MTEVPQANIFINYRRSDTGWAADHVASKLKRTFGEDRVFLDVRGIDAGDEFDAVLEVNLRQAAILVVLIGKDWLHVRDKYGRRRLDHQDDWVRHEIRMGLQQQRCRVIPVLIDDAELPDDREALPKDIAELLGRERMRVRQANSDDDIEALSRELNKAGFRRLHDSTELFRGQPLSMEQAVGLPANQLFQIKPIQAMGENIYYLETRREEDLTEKFYVRVHFNFWTKHVVQMINVDLTHGIDSLAGSQTIFLNRTLEPLNESGRLRTHAEINTGAVLDVQIHREFESKFSHSRDSDALMLDFEIASLQWSGIRHLRATAKLAPGGELRNLKLKWNKNRA